MTRKIEHVSRVDYQSMTGIERREHGFDGLYNQWSCTEFYENDDNYDLYVNMDDMCDDYNQRKYAVYQHSTGELKCLLGDAVMALDLCYDDNDFRDKRHELYRQIALAAGWPEKMSNKKRYTVRMTRRFDVEVRADDKFQATRIGWSIIQLADDRTAVGNVVGKVREALESTYFDVEDVHMAEDEDSGYWDMSLSESECNEILKEG